MSDQDSNRPQTDLRSPGPDDPDQEAFPPASPPERDTSLRQRLVQQFELWLDRMLAGEPAPQGIPEELLVQAQQTPEPGGRDCDLYTLFAALTSLSGEIRLQGRAFKQLTDAISPSLLPLAEVVQRLERIEAAHAELGAWLEAREADAVEEEGALPPTREVLAVLFDLYDRFERGMQSLKVAMEHCRPPGGWLARWSGAARTAGQAAAVAKAVREGYELSLSRLQAALQQWGIARIGEPGEQFDPRHMTAIEVEQRADVPAGTVLEVYRSGFAHHERVLLGAQVKVARAAGRQD